MSGIGRTRMGPFVDFSGYSATAVKECKYASSLPFAAPTQGQITFGPSEYLAWALTDYLANRHCVVRRAAALAVRCSGVADVFLYDLGRGENVSDVHLAIWHEAGDRDDQRWVGILRSDEIAELRHARRGSEVVCYRLSGDTLQRELRVPGKVTGVTSVFVLAQWKAAVERARQVGLDLRPGSVTVLVDPVRRQSRKIAAAGV